MLKKITGAIALLVILTGCKDSGSPTVTAGTLPSLLFSNGKSQISLFRNNSQSIEFSCHPELVVEKVEIDGNQVSLGNYLLDIDTDCTDSKGFFTFPQEVFDGSFSINIFTKAGAMEATTSQIFIKDTPDSLMPELETKDFSLNEDGVLADSIAINSPDGSNILLTITQAPTSGVLTIGQDGSVNYTPNPNYNGDDFFTIKAINNSGETQKNYKVSVAGVNDKPVGSSGSFSLNEDTSRAVSLSGVDTDGDTMSFVIVSSPTNGTITGTGSDYTYTPNLNYFGSDTVTYKINDGIEDSDTYSLNFTVVALNDTPADISKTVSLNEDSSLAISTVSTDIEGDPLSYSLIQNVGNGTLTGTLPNVNYSGNTNYQGTDSFVVRISDGVSSVDSTITINVSSINDNPISSGLATLTQEDTQKIISLSASDVDGDSLSYVIVSNPSNGTLSGSGSSRTYTPSLNFNGSDSFTYKVNDGTVDSNVSTVSITVVAVNDIPTATSMSLTLVEDGSKSFTLSGTDVESGSVTYSIVSTPSDGTLSGSSPNLTYTPNSNYNGTDSLTYKVNDGTADSAVATITFNTTAVNDIPEVSDESLTIDEDTSLVINLTGTDVEGDSLNFQIEEGPQNGTLSGDAPNFTYIPNENFNGVDTFSYYADDGVANGAVKTISITVNPLNDAPESWDQSYEMNQDSSLDFNIDGTDVEGDSFGFVIVQQPTNGTLNISGSDLEYVPDSGYDGNENIQFKLYDGTDHSIIHNIDILVKSLALATRNCSIRDNGVKIGDGTETSSNGGVSWGSCNATACIDGYDVVGSECKTLVPEIYIGEGFFMDHKKLDGTDCSISDCHYVGDKRKVETDEVSCSGLTLEDSEANFIWSCKEESGKAVFYSRINLKSNILEKSIDEDALDWNKTKLSLVGATQSATQSVEFNPWNDSVRTVASVLSQKNTVYIIPDNYRGSITITADGISLVGDYHFDNNTYDYTSSCLLTQRCHIKSITQNFLFFEVNFKPILHATIDSSNSNTQGIYLNSVFKSYIFDSSFSFLDTALNIDYGEKNTIYRNSFFNNRSSAEIVSNETVILKNSFTHSTDAIQTLGDGNVINSNTFLNNEDALWSRGDDNYLSNSVFIRNEDAIVLDDYDNSVVSNIVAINNIDQNLYVRQSGGTTFEHQFSFNYSDNGFDCVVSASSNILTDCSASWGVHVAGVSISQSSLFDVGSYSLGLYDSVNFERDKMTVPNTVGVDQVGPYGANNNSLNFNVFDLKFNENYFTSDFKIYGQNISVDPSVSTPSINAGSTCPSFLEEETSVGGLVHALEMPLTSGNQNGVCEDGEICEYVDQYGGVMKNSVFDKTKTICEFSILSTELYPAQK